MNTIIPWTRELVLVGGGHCHGLVLRQWGMDPLAGVRLTLIDPMVATAYTGMLPGHVAGHYARSELDIDLVRLARHAGARFIQDRAVGLDTASRRVRLASGRQVGFDIASIDIGITSRLPLDTSGPVRAVPAKPLGPFAAAWQAFLGEVQAGKAPAEAVVIGGGVAGCELAIAMRHALVGTGQGNARVTLIEAGDMLASELPGSVRNAIEKALLRCGVSVLTAITASDHDGVRLNLSDGTSLPAAFVAGAAGAAPQAWLADTGLALENGYIRVDAQLRSLSHPDVFAVGDCAHMTHAPRPKAGVYAVRQAPVLTDNLRAALSGTGRMRAYRPQSDYLKLVSTGRRRAIANKGMLTLSGDWLWRFKDRIDRRFMDRLRDLPTMQARLPGKLAAGVRDALAPDAMPCAGCGAKVTRAALSGGLGNLAQTHRSDIVAGPGDDSAIVKIGGACQVITTDHLRAVCDDPYLMAKIAAVHALGDIWAMGAAPQAALASLVVPHASAAIQAEMVGEIMVGAGEIFAGAGAEIVGGHTSMGAEMTLGFTVTGLLERAAIRQSGARPGDRLVLTRPVGTGVILAAEMRRRADARDVAAAWQSMSRPLGAASEILSPHAHAMTDVTGFGLAGHLMAMLEASQVSAMLELACVPLLPGAEALASAGIRSSLWADNAALAGVERPPGARSDLLFDPQTSGGLLAAVAPDVADQLVAQLCDAGERAAVIGEIGDGPARLVVR